MRAKTKKCLSLISICLAPLLAGPAVAGDWVPDRLILLAGTHHFDAKLDFESFTPGALAVWEHGRFSLNLGGFRNSFGDFSPTVGGGFSLYKTEDFDFGGFLNLAYYPDVTHVETTIGDNIVPMAGAYMRAGKLFFQGFPNVGDAASAVVTVGISIPLK